MRMSFKVRSRCCGCGPTGSIDQFTRTNSPATTGTPGDVSNGGTWTPATPPQHTFNGQRGYGWKGAAAKKAWHGRYDFSHSSGSKDGVKYLHCYKIAYDDMSKTVLLPGGPPFSYELVTGAKTIVQEFKVDRTSGTQTCVQWSNVSSTTDPVWPMVAGTFTNNDAIYGDLWAVCGNHDASGYGGSPNFVAILTAAAAGTWNSGTPGFSYTYSLTNTELLVTYRNVIHNPGHPDDVYTGILHWILTEPYHLLHDAVNTPSEPSVEDDVTTMLQSWPLSNDTIYPWRSDTACTVNPLCEAVEAGPTAPSNCLSTSPGACPVIIGSTFSGESLGAPTTDWRPSYWDGWHPNETWGGSSFSTASYGAACPSSVSAWGLPPTCTHWTPDSMACNFFYPGASAVLFADVLYVQKFAVTDRPRPSLNYARPFGNDRWLRQEQTLAGVFGVQCPSWVGLVATCPASPSWPASCVVIVTGTNAGAWTATVAGPAVTLLVKQADLPTWMGSENAVGLARFWSTAWPIPGSVTIAAATAGSPIAIVLADACDGLQTGDKIDITGTSGISGMVATGLTVTRTSTDGKHFTIGVNGTGTYDDGATAVNASVNSPPALTWFTRGSQGDVVVSTLAHNARGGADTADCTQKTGLGSNGCPWVWVFSPNAGDVPTQNGSSAGVFGWPNDNAGGRWQGYVRTSVPDPFWQQPHTPCAGGAWVEDLSADGVTGNYAHRPMVEATTAAPGGAPGLPSGVSPDCWGACVNCGVPGLTSCPNGTCGMVDPVLWLQEQARCPSGAFVLSYQANGVLC